MDQKKKWSFFPKQSSYIHWDHKPNSIKRRKHEKVGRGGTNWARGRKRLLRAESWVQCVTTMASKGKGKKKEMKEICKFFLVIISKRTKFWRELGRERFEETRKGGRTFVCKCIMKVVGLFSEKHCDQRGDFWGLNGQSAAFQSPIVPKIKEWPEHCNITAYRWKSDRFWHRLFHY